MIIELKKTSEHFNRMRMVCLSVSENNSSYAISYVYVDADYIVATDGNRLAQYVNYGLAPGFYRVVKNIPSVIQLDKVEGDDIGRFPAYKMLIPTKPVEDADDEDDDSLETLHYVLSIAAYRINWEGFCINLDHLKDYMDCDEYYIRNSKKPIAFYTKDFVGIIMPVDPNK